MSAENSDSLWRTRVGAINNDVISKKYERTDMYEDPDLMYNHFRNSLRDTGPDNPNTFAEDQKREGGIGKRNGVLNIRENGKRSLIEPKHTEIFTELTGKDDRGVSNLPIMSKMNDQSRHRAKNYELSFKDDGDNSIVESARNPGQVSKDKKDTMQRSKQKLQIFEDSEIGWASRNPQINTQKSLKEKVMEDTHYLDVSDAAVKQRRSNVTELTNTSQIGWLSQNDQKIKISNYAKVYTGNGKAVDTRYAQNEQLTDQKIVKYRDTYIPASVASLMHWHTIARQNYLETIPVNSRYWGKVKENYVRTNININVNDNVSRMSNEKDKASISSKSIKKEITEQLRSINVSRFKGHKIEDTEQSARILSLMKQSVEARNSTGKLDENDLVKIKHEISNTHKKVKQINPNGISTRKITINQFKGLTKDDTLINNKFGKTMTVHNYSNNSKIHSDISNVGKSDNSHDEIIDHNDVSVRSISKFQNDLIMNKNDTNVEENFQDSGVKTRHGGLIGKKYLVKEHTMDHELNEVNDV
jgi:hypothetical protein